MIINKNNYNICLCTLQLLNISSLKFIFNKDYNTKDVNFEKLMFNITYILINLINKFYYLFFLCSKLEVLGKRQQLRQLYLKHVLFYKKKIYIFKL